MAGPIYVAGRTPLSSVAGGSIIAPSLLDPYIPRFAGYIQTQPTVSAGARTAPVLIASRQVADWQANPADKDIGASISWQTGDVIVVMGVTEDQSSTIGTPAVAGLTFSAIGSPSSTASSTWVHRWSATAASNGSGIVTISRITGTLLWGAALWQYRGSDGLGAQPATSTAVNVKVISLTTTQPNSAVVAILGDWGAGATGSPTWTPGGSTQLVANDGGSATYSVLAASWADIASVSTANYGLTAGLSTTQNISKAVVEILGTGSSSTNVTGDSALTSESDLIASASVATTGVTALSGQSTLTAAGVIVQTGAAVLTAESNLTAAGIVVVPGVSVLSSQSTLTATGSNRVIGAATLSGQSTLISNGVANVLAVSVLSGQSTLTASGLAKTTAISTLSVQSTLTVTPVVTTTSTSTLNAELTLTAAGIIGATPATAILSAQSTLTVTGSNNALGAASLSGQSTLTAAGLAKAIATATLSGQSTLTSSGLASTTGIALMSAQSTLTASGTVGATPASANLSSQSNLTASGNINVQGISVLSGQSTLTANGSAKTFAIGPLTIQSTLTANGVRVIFGVSGLSVQSTLSATGIIPAIVTGASILSGQSILTVAGESSPPWVFRFIEFTDSKVTGTESDTSISSFDSTSNLEG